MPRHLGTSLLLVFAALTAAGCEGDLPRMTEITRMRVLGARLEVVGDEQRATPRPGEMLRVTLPVVFPSIENDGSELRTLMIGCTAPDRFTGGLPICQELIDAALSGSGTPAASPSFSMFQEKVRCGEGVLVNNYVQLGAVSGQCLQGAPVAQLPVPRNFGDKDVLFAGVVCEEGTPFIDAEDPQLFGCEHDHGEALRFHGVARVLHEEADENHNPSLDALQVMREAAFDWPAFEGEQLPPENDCTEQAGEIDDLSLPKVVAAGELPVTLRYDAAAREELDGKPEDLEFTVYTTYGEMERRFTLFEGDDGGEDGLLENDVKWDPPKAAEVPDGGKLVQFYITLRDQRGGFAVTTRTLCVAGL